MPSHVRRIVHNHVNAYNDVQNNHNHRNNHDYHDCIIDNLNYQKHHNVHPGTLQQCGRSSWMRHADSKTRLLA